MREERREKRSWKEKIDEKGKKRKNEEKYK